MSVVSPITAQRCGLGRGMGEVGVADAYFLPRVKESPSEKYIANLDTMVVFAGKARA